MKASEIMTELLNERGLSERAFGARIGKPQQTVWTRLHNQKDMTVSMFSSMLSALDCELVVQPRQSAGRRPEGSRVVS